MLNAGEIRAFIFPKYMYAVAQTRVVQISDPIVWTHINSYRPTHQVRPAYYYLMTVQDAD